MACNLYNESKITTISLHVQIHLRAYFTSYIDVSSLAVADHKTTRSTLITRTKEFIQNHTNPSIGSLKHEGMAQEQILLYGPCQVPICIYRRSKDHAHLLHPRVFLFHNVRTL
jgi:hypothetical protein